MILFLEILFKDKFLIIKIQLVFTRLSFFEVLIIKYTKIYQITIIGNLIYLILFTQLLFEILFVTY